MKKCLVVVDYQYDFVADDGFLTAGKPAQKIEDTIYNKVNEYIQNGHNVIFTMDTHCEKNWDIHPESKQFSIHCEKNKKGHNLYGKLQQFCYNKNVVFIEKKAYCPCEKELEFIIRDNDEVEVLGVVTDICVLQTCIGLYTLSVNSSIPVRLKVCENGCASFSEEGHSYAISYMRDILGFEVV